MKLQIHNNFFIHCGKLNNCFDSLILEKKDLLLCFDVCYCYSLLFLLFINLPNSIINFLTFSEAINCIWRRKYTCEPSKIHQLQKKFEPQKPKKLIKISHITKIQQKNTETKKTETKEKESMYIHIEIKKA